MKNIFHRLLPVTSLLCLPLLGGYTPVASREGLALDEAQLAEFNNKAVYQTGSVIREYPFTVMGNAPIDGPRDWFGNDDFRFFSMLTNFQCGTITGEGNGSRCSMITSEIVARNTRGQEFITTIRPGNGAYGQSHLYRGYGRFHFNAGKPRVYGFYGRNANGTPRTNRAYLDSVQRDLLVRATGIPHPGRKADRAGW